MIHRAFVVLLLLPAMVAVADDLKVAQLEQDVRDLQRQVQVLARQLEAQRVSPPAAPPARALPRTAAETRAAVPSWVDATRWARIKPGMGELEVLGILGPPTTMRVEDSTRVLLYAMEVGPSGFLGGSVSLKDRSVVSVRHPTLQ